MKTVAVASFQDIARRTRFLALPSVPSGATRRCEPGTAGSTATETSIPAWDGSLALRKERSWSE
jgi:hypothetical protein